MLIIFLLSNQPGEVSKELSESVADTLDITQTSSYLSKSTTPIFAGLSLRKYAHIFLYALLGLFSFLTVKDMRKSSICKILIAVGICYGYGCLDEVHQFFIDGRTALLRDTFIDALGFIPAILMCFVISKGICRYRKLREDKN